MKVDWAFLRNSWKTCGKTREFLGTNDIQIETELNARKERIEADAAWDLFSDADMIYVINGRKINEWAPTADNKETILAKAIGRSGNLRAPTLKIKGAFVVGFNKDVYAKLLLWINLPVPG